MAETYICFCGPVQPAGDDTDKAICLDCDWTATGAAADHLGTHHHKATKHTWKLLWGGAPV